jgi:signal transduction histidine kinase/ligand-binding sensor domain-containing protein
MLAHLAVILMQAIPAGAAAVRPISELVHTRWGMKEGAPVEARALAQTTDGYLWIGAQGLFRFDGIRFVPFVPPDTMLRGRGVRRLVASRAGWLWIVWVSGQVSRLRDGQLTTWGDGEGLPLTYDLTESSSGIVVAGTSKGLSRFRDGAWHDANEEWTYPGTQSRALWFDRDDGLWAQTESRVVHLPAGARRFVDPNLPLARAAVQAEFVQERDGTMWMTELYRSTHTLRRAGDSLPETELLLGGWTLLVDRKGGLWVGTLGDGLRRIPDPTRVRGRKIEKFGPEAETFTTQDGLLSDVVYSLLEDREGSIWVGTSRGVERFREGAFTPFMTPGAIRSRHVHATRDSAVWIRAYAHGGLQRIDPRSGTMEEISTRIIPLTVRQDRSGVIWTMNGRNVYNYDPAKRDFVALELRRNDAKALRDVAVDSAGTAWFVDETMGLMRLAGDSLVQVEPLPPSIGPGAFLLYDRKGRMWIGRQDRVMVYEHGRLTTFDPSLGEVPPYILDFYEDRGGNVWTVGPFGLSRFEGRRFRTIPERQGVPERTVYGVAEDQDGGWWLTTRTGVLRLPPGEVERALADSTHVLRYRRFDRYDGLPGELTSGVPAQSIATGADGRIWVGTDSGVARIDPRNLHEGAAPAALVEGMRIDDRELPWPGDVTIPPGGRDLEIDYTSTGLATPERVAFRYMLEGEDPGWREVGSRRRAYYTGLGPGRYTFRVSATNGDGIWSEAAPPLLFRIEPAWFQTVWFQAGVILLILGAGAATAWLVQRQRHEREQQVLTRQHEATLAERTRIAQDLHDTLLQGIAGVSLHLKAAERALPDHPDVAAETLIRVQRLTRDALREARERVLDLHEPDGRHPDLAEALRESGEGLVAASGARFSLTASGERRRLPRPLEVTAILIAREAIANAVRHAEARRIDVAIGFGPEVLRMEVCDDGRGITAEAMERAREDGHLGLSGMRERAARLGGRCEVRRKAEGGTAVSVELPLEAGQR